MVAPSECPPWTNTEARRTVRSRDCDKIPDCFSDPWRVAPAVFLRRPLAVVSSIYHLRFGIGRRWTPIQDAAQKPHRTPRKPTEPSGSVKWIIATGIVGFAASRLALSVSIPRRPYTAVLFSYPFRVGRWAPMAAPSGRRPEARGAPLIPHGAVKLGNTNKIRIFGFRARPFCFLSSSPISGGFVYFNYRRRVGRWGLAASPPESPPETHGSPRNSTEQCNCRIKAMARNFAAIRVGLAVFCLRRPSRAVLFIFSLHFRVWCWVLTAAPPEHIPKSLRGVTGRGKKSNFE